MAPSVTKKHQGGGADKKGQATARKSTAPAVIDQRIGTQDGDSETDQLVRQVDRRDVLLLGRRC